MEGTIHISNVIAELRSTLGVSHKLQFIYGKGKKQGQIGELTNCTYGTGIRTGEAKTTKNNAPRKNAVWKKDGTIPIYDLESKRVKTLLISHLRKFDGFIIKH